MEWIIDHTLEKKPSVVITDDNENAILTSYHYNGEGQIIVTFLSPRTGKVFLT